MNPITQQVLNAVIAKYGADTTLGELTLEQVNEIMVDTQKLTNIRDGARTWYEAGIRYEQELHYNGAPAELIALQRGLIESFYAVHQFAEAPYWTMEGQS